MVEIAPLAPPSEHPAEQAPDHVFFELMREECSKAYQMGRADGEKVGYEKAQEEQGALLHLLGAISEKFLEQKKQLLEKLKPEMIELAIACSERVVRVELSQREKLVKLIDSLLELNVAFFEGEVVKIYLCPEDLVMIEASLTHQHSAKKEIKSLKFVSDSLMKRGDFRIETKQSLLNFNLSRELEDLRSKIMRM